MNKSNVLLDSQFLVELDNHKQRELYVKVISLTLDEQPVDEIQGRVTGGSISVDGSSKLRRSCSLNLISERLDINDYLWCLNTKIKVSIGMRNFIEDDPLEGYGDIIWFPQGTFVLNSFSISVNNTSSTISLQGKDKMCLLNGDVGGNLTALSYAFDIVEEENGYNSYYKKKLPLHYIIREAVHTFANEPYHNIIINDLDDWGLELLKYRGEEPMYFVYSVDDEDITNMTINPEQKYYFIINGRFVEKSITELERLGFKFKVLNDFVSQDEGDSDTVFADAQGNKPYKLIKIEYGMTCGYRLTDLVYASDLILNVGEGLTSMLDKIVSMLGNFEYYYDLAGQFVFQKKRTYVNTSWNNLTNNGEEQWADSAAYTSSSVYSLYNSKLVSQFQNAPALNNVKNDFSIWGTKKGATGVEMPIHMRYAIDKKPTYYTTVDGKMTYTTKTKEQVEADKASGLLDAIGKGYQKEPSRFGLSEDWWEVRDWANAWAYSGLPIPDKNLGAYCPIRAYIHPEGTPYQGGLASNVEDYEVSQQVWDSWGPAITMGTTDDLIFFADGNYNTRHGWCSHNYASYWLAAFEEGGRYAGGYAYFYKPQIPAEDIVADGGQGLLLGEAITYEADWRELIYQMALDHNKYGNVDNSNPKTQLVKARKQGEGKDIIMTKQQYLEAPQNTYLNMKEISVNTAIRERNPSFYPSGYTGYEQYYIDVLGFWRQLYNPDYECTYEIEVLTKVEFEAVKEERSLYYDAPVYEHCSDQTIFYNTIDYYTHNAAKNEYSLASMLTESEFNRNKSRYYYIKDMEIKPVPIKTTTPVAGKKYYKIGNYDEEEDGKNLKAGTAKDPKDYCIRTEVQTITPIWKLEPYNRAYLYNYRKQGTYYPVSQGIFESDYQSRPWYYYRVKDGKQICCTSISAPSPRNRSSRAKFATLSASGEWKFISPTKEWELDNGKKIVLNAKVTNEDLEAYCSYYARQWQDDGNSSTTTPENLLLYIHDSYYEYEPLVGPAIEFDSSGTYYIKSEVKEFNCPDKGVQLLPENLPDPNQAPYWKTDLLTNPEGLIFWFDFLDTDGELDNYSVKRIGDRPKAVNDKDVKAIYFRETPGVLFLNPDEWSEYAGGAAAYDKPTGYAYAQMPSYLSHLFTISSQGKSAKDVLDQYLYQYSYCTETVTVTSLPIYHLEPNTRILIRDDNSHINGEYIVNKLTIPLDPKGTMTINAVKAVDRLY